MPIRLLVSADSNQTHFIDCIKQICDDSKGEYEFHNLPKEVSKASEEDRLERMLSYIDYADLILMDVTPHTFPSEVNKYKHMSNQGVLIEYGVIISRKDRDWRLKLFCEDTVERKHLHPYILKTVDTYNRNKLGLLRDKIVEVMKKHKEDILKKQRIGERQLLGLEKYIIHSNKGV